ncbi:MAG: hypothetical protein ACK58T_38490, partial [Phycisphaerae bacterium]
MVARSPPRRGQVSPLGPPGQPRAGGVQPAPIAFSREAELPVAGGFDTGWIPADSPLQVHLVA